MKIQFAILLFFLTSCSAQESRLPTQKTKESTLITRLNHQQEFVLESPVKVDAPLYPWESRNRNRFSSISKEFFRCKGSHLNPVHVVTKKNQVEHYYDCGGATKHSLPLREGKEFVFPILLDLLNYLQEKTGKRVVITSGHRCPEHNLYVDASAENQTSKHMIGAEVAFYVQGMEFKPEKVVQILLDYYATNPLYKGQKDYEVFLRYEKDDVKIETAPWFNKEVFIKLFKAHEGRNFDNRHPYPYLDIQVRYDRDLKERVIYTWEKANRNYYRQ